MVIQTNSVIAVVFAACSTGKAVCLMCMLRGNSDRIIGDGYHPNAYKMVKAIYPKRQRYKSLHLFGLPKPALRIL